MTGRRDEPTARRFARVRRDHARETAEDYAELVLDLAAAGRPVRPADLARGLGVSHVTVLRALDRLIRDGIVDRDAEQGIVLSAAGRRMGQAARARHALVVEFLARIGVPPEIAAVDAEGIEHHVSAVTIARMEAFVARRATATKKAPAARRK